MIVNLSNFRSAFLNAQNKANFYNSGKEMIHEFRILQMQERIENNNDEDVMTLLLYKERIIFYWRLDGQSQVVYLNKSGQNWFEHLDWMFLHERIMDRKPTQKISLYNPEIIRQVAQRITDLFTGTNWDEMPLAS